MRKKPASQFGFFIRRILIGCAFCSIVVLLVAFVLYPGGTARAQGTQQNQQAQTGPLTPEELQKLAEGIKPLVNQSTEGLVEVHHADGSVSMDLQGRFQSVAVAKKEADGTIKTSCIDNLASFAAFFGINPELLGAAKPAPGSTTQPDSKQPEKR